MSETFIERDLSKLAEQPELDVHVISLKKGSGNASPVLHDRISYISLKLKDLGNGMKLIGSHFKVFIDLCVESFNNTNRSFVSSLYLIIKAFSYSTIFLSYKPDHIHVHFLSEPSTLIYYVSLITGIPFSISAHARDVFGNNKNKILNAEMVPNKVKKAQFIVICNIKAWEMCRVLAGSDSDLSKIILHYHGIDTSIFSNLNNKTLQGTVPFIFSVGRLEEKKGFTYLIKASKILHDRGVSHTLKIAGPGPLYSVLQQQIVENAQSDYVEILGEGRGIDNSAVLNYVSQATVFALPSIETADNDAEGIPNTLVEASFLKKAIVSTYTGGIPELITTEVNGLLVEQKNEYQLADTLERLIVDGNLREFLGNNAYTKACEKFDLEKNILELKSLFLK
jgi:glycosyltransferase involved in cell wall biosynthesis